MKKILVFALTLLLSTHVYAATDQEVLDRASGVGLSMLAPYADISNIKIKFVDDIPQSKVEQVGWAMDCGRGVMINEKRFMPLTWILKIRIIIHEVLHQIDSRLCTPETDSQRELVEELTDYIAKKFSKEYLGLSEKQFDFNGIGYFTLFWKWKLESKHYSDQQLMTFFLTADWGQLEDVYNRAD